MITDLQVFRIKTQEGDIEAVVNWNDAETVKESRMIKFKIDGKEWHIKCDDLVTLLLTIGDSEAQKKLLPCKLKTIRKYETILSFVWTASKDYKKGEKINVQAPHIVEIPVEENIFSGNLKTKKQITKGGLIINNK